MQLTKFIKCQDSLYLMEDNPELEKRKEKVIDLIKKYQNYIQYLILAAIIWLSYKIRTQSVPLLKDVTTGK